MQTFDRPIVVIGAARSGTQLVGGLIGAHPDVFYVGEAKYVWTYANSGIGHDMIPASRATPKVRDFIRGRFAEHLARSGRPRFAEKTPSNSLRLPFVTAVLPEARIVHILRDGRDVAVSGRIKFHGQTRKISRAALDGGAPRPGPARETFDVLRRARKRIATGIPLRDWPDYLPEFTSSALAQIGIRDTAIWGPRIPGLRRLMKSHSLIEVAAIQWRECVEHTCNFRASHSEWPWLELRFEDLCAKPAERVRELMDFCELEMNAEVEEAAEAILAPTPRAFVDALTPEELELVNGHVGWTVQQLGYDL